MAAAVPFIMMAGAAVSAYGAIQQGQAAKAAAQFNETVNTQNADLSRQEAADNARLQDRENYLRLGAIRAAQGEAGGAAGEGSVLDVIGMVAAQGEEERQRIVYAGELKARGFTNTATLDRFGGKQAVKNSYFKAGGELLGGAGAAYMASAKLAQAGSTVKPSTYMGWDP